VKQHSNRKSVKHSRTPGEIKCLQFLFESRSRGFVSNVGEESVPHRLTMEILDPPPSRSQTSRRRRFYHVSQIFR